MGPTCNYPVGLSAAYRTIARPVCTITADPRVRRPCHGAYHTYLGIFGIQATTARLHFNYKTSTTCEYGAYTFG